MPQAASAGWNAPALAPWVEPGDDRTKLAAVGAELAPGSGTARENDYVETALIADLPFPVRRDRRGCVGPPQP